MTVCRDYITSQEWGTGNMFEEWGPNHMIRKEHGHKTNRGVRLECHHQFFRQRGPQNIDTQSDKTGALRRQLYPGHFQLPTVSLSDAPSHLLSLSLLSMLG